MLHSHYLTTTSRVDQTNAGHGSGHQCPSRRSRDSHAYGAASGSVDRSPFRNEFDVRNRSHDAVKCGERRNGEGRMNSRSMQRHVWSNETVCRSCDQVFTPLHTLSIHISVCERQTRLEITEKSNRLRRRNRTVFFSSPTCPVHPLRKQMQACRRVHCRWEGLIPGGE